MSFYKIIKSLTDQAPEILLEQIVKIKMKDAGVKAWRGGAKALTKHLIDRKAGEFHWEDYPDGGADGITIEFTKEDGQKIEKLYDDFEGKLETTISDMLGSVIDKMLSDYQEDWQGYRRQEERYVSNFRNNLEDRWGVALDGLRLLLDLCRDEGQKYLSRLEKSKAKSSPYQRILLSRLHSRACQVTAEIITLLESGFAKGAMARWRTLHEIEVIATVIKEADNSTAQRFLDYEVVESKRAKDQYAQNHEELGYKPLSKKEMAEIEADYASVIDRYGPDFRHPYGWAAEFLKNKSPRFSDLEKLAGSARMRSHYKFASYNVHASPKSLTVRIDDFSNSDWPIAGASNAGLQEPGQNTTLTVLRITYLLTENLRNIDNAIVMNALINLRDETIDAFATCAFQLEADDAEIRSAVQDYEIDVDTTLI